MGKRNNHPLFRNAFYQVCSAYSWRNLKKKRKRKKRAAVISLAIQFSVTQHKEQNRV